MERESFQRAHCTTNSGEDSTVDGCIDKKMRWCRLLTVLCIVSQPGGNNWWEDRAGIHKGSPDMQQWLGEDLISKSRMSTWTLRVLCVCLVWRSCLYPCIRSSSWVCWLQTQRGQRGEQGPGSRAPVLGLHPHHQVHCQQGHTTGARGLPCSECSECSECHYVLMSLCHHVMKIRTYRSAFTLQTDNICNIMKEKIMISWT